MDHTVASAVGWNVAAWTVGPREPFRLNALFHPDRGAVVTASGRFDGSTAAARLAAVLVPFEQLACRVVVDVCHAVLDEQAVRILVEAAGRRRPVPAPGFTVSVAHADAATRRRVVRAGGAALLVMPGRVPRAAAG